MLEAHHPFAVEVDTVSKSFLDGQRIPLLGRLRGSAPAKRVIAIDRVSLTVPRGEIYGILGANGSGKSTLIRLISTLLFPDQGELHVFGHDIIKEDLVVKRMINRVSVEAAFFRVLSPTENLMYAARMYGVDAQVARKRIVEILGQLGIDRRRLGEPLQKMSRGMQQKVAIARALLTSPVLLLLDEPTTGLDPRSKREVQQLVLRVRAEHNATVILTTHDLDEAERLCDRIAVLDQGRIVAEGTADELKRQPGLSADASLEDVFMALTGRPIEEEVEESVS
ncbi:MAG TPA: ABC transporter ATP-binding protein [Chloroflexota bacterium]|nr:ABC transporter ATP-binding protein [Chloroflexota bacterium]